MTRQPLWVILCHLPEKGRRDRRGDEREGHGMKVKKQKIPPLPLPATRIAGLAQP